MSRIFGRLLEMLLIGAGLEIAMSFLLYLVFKQETVTDHLASIVSSNGHYLMNSYWIGEYIWHPIQHYAIAPVDSVLGGLGKVGNIAHVISLTFADAITIYVQKVIIALISIPIYLIFVVIALYDGWVQRELRRYRVGIESTRREKFEIYVVRLERFAFIGFISIPLYIPAPIWFLVFGIAVAMVQQMTTTFEQKYL